MIGALTTLSPEIAELCRRFGVRRLDVFGSASRGVDFDPARSDADFLVSFEQSPPKLADFFALRDALASILHRPVDLVMEGAVRNPYVLASMNRERETVYGP